MHIQTDKKTKYPVNFKDISLNDFGAERLKSCLAMWRRTSDSWAGRCHTLRAWCNMAHLLFWRGTNKSISERFDNKILPKPQQVWVVFQTPTIWWHLLNGIGDKMINRNCFMRDQVPLYNQNIFGISIFSILAGSSFPSLWRRGWTKQVTSGWKGRGRPSLRRPWEGWTPQQ